MDSAVATSQKLALLGGSPAVSESDSDLFHWPITTSEDEEAVLDVIRRGTMSGTEISIQFEKEFAAWQGSRHALGFCNGTAGLQAAMAACGVGEGDEVISPSITYWASTLPVFALRATPVFADIDPDSLCLDAGDFEARITERTRAVVVVHYVGHPADMDAIMEVARKHGVKVIEDTSHAQGGLYKGKRVGTFGDVAVASLMSQKSLPAGEGGMLTTDDLEIYERSLAWAHHSRFSTDLKTPGLAGLAGLPMGGIKGRMHQVSAAMGRVQLRYNDQRCAEMREAMEYFWSELEGVPGLRQHGPPSWPESNMAGHYSSRAHYVPEELEGLPVGVFCEAVRAEGTKASPGCNRPLHLHPLLSEADIYHSGHPTRYIHGGDNLRQGKGSLPASEATLYRVLSTPWFHRFYPEEIARHALAFRKVAENYKLLMDHPDPAANSSGAWGLSVI